MRLASGLSILFAAVLALGATAARATEWVPVAGTAKYLAEIDLASAEVKKDVVKVWVRQTYDKPQQDEETHRPFVVEMYQTTEDCSQRTHVLGDFVLRGKDGQIIRSGVRNDGVKPVLPGSIGEGTSPRRTIRSGLLPGTGCGIADSRAFV